MSDHKKFSDLTKDWGSERRAAVENEKDRIATEHEKYEMSDQAHLAEIKRQLHAEINGDRYIGPWAMRDYAHRLLALCERQREELDTARELLAAVLEESTYREDEQDETVFSRARAFLSRSTGADDGKR